jgi:hypothetical protein
MTSSVGRAVQVAVAALVAVTTSLLLPVAPASAAACPTADGVTVVVDFHDLGGGVQSACVPDGVRASDLFPAAGFPLDYVQRPGGFVCRVDGEPVEERCVDTPPADAYWGLWWSDGKSGRWSYATTGVAGLTIPDGGYVAFSWNGSSRTAPPSTSPTAHRTPTPTQQPSQQPSQQPTKQPGQHQSSSAPQPGGGSSSASGSGSDGPSVGPSAGASAKPMTKTEDAKQDQQKKNKGRGASATATPDASDAPSPRASATDDVAPASSEAQDADDGGLPAWVAPVVVVLLFGAAGAVAVIRRRRSGPV